MGEVLLAVAASAAAEAAPASVLAPAAGADAQRIADFFWWMAFGSAVVWAAAVGFLFYCLRAPRRPPLGRPRLPALTAYLRALR